MKQNLFKTLLLAATLLVGGANYAWADAGDETTNADINFSNAITDGVVAGSTNSMSVGAGVISDEWLRLYDGTSTITIPSAERAGNKDVVKINFKMAWGNKKGMGSGFRIKDAEGTSIGSFQIARWDGSGTNSNTFGIESIGSYMAGHYNNAPLTARYTQFEFTINYATKKISTYVSCPSASTSNTFEVTLTNTNPVASIEFWGYGVGGNYDRASVIDDVLITTTEGDYSAVYANYTINYKIGDNLVKSVEGSDVVGSTITADAAVDGTEEGYVGNHYLIVAGSAPSMDLVANAASNVLNVPVRAPYTATLTVTKNIGGVAQTPTVTNLVETDGKVCTWNYVYRMYEQEEGVYYVADNTSSFGESGSFTNGQSINKTVYYTNPDYSVVYFGEPNEVTGTNTTYSNGNTGFITGGKAYDSNVVIRLGTLPAGEYRLITKVTGNANRNVVVGDCTDTSAFPVSLVTITTTGAKDEEFTLNSPTPISVSGKDQGKGKFNQSADVDYILVKASELKVTIGTYGWATLYTPYALNFDGTGLTAYTASVDGETVTLTEVSDVPANTGVVLNGAAGNYDIPVIASSSTEKGDLQGDAVNATVVDAANKYYALSYVSATNKVQFNPVANGQSIAAGKAYLVDESGLAKAFTVEFAGADAISDVRSKMEDGRNEIFNLAGQRMSKLQRGVNIVNGKKVMVK